MQAPVGVYHVPHNTGARTHTATLTTSSFSEVERAIRALHDLLHNLALFAITVSSVAVIAVVLLRQRALDSAASLSLVVLL